MMAQDPRGECLQTYQTQVMWMQRECLVGSISSGPQKSALPTFSVSSLARLLTEYLWYSFVLKGHPLVHSSLKFTQPGYPIHYLFLSLHVQLGAVSGTPIRIPLDVVESPLTMRVESFPPCSTEAQIKNLEWQ